MSAHTVTRKYVLDERVVNDTRGGEPESRLLAARAHLRAGREEDGWKILDQLWRHYSRRLIVAYVAKRAIPAHLRLDVVDDARVRCYVAWVSADPKHEFWVIRFNMCLYRLIGNECDRLWRMLNRRHEADDDWWMRQEAQTTEARVGSVAESLPPVWRYAMERSAEGYSDEAIARALRCTARTIRNYRVRSRSHLTRLGLAPAGRESTAA